MNELKDNLLNKLRDKPKILKEIEFRKKRISRTEKDIKDQEDKMSELNTDIRHKTAELDNLKLD